MAILYHIRGPRVSAIRASPSSPVDRDLKKPLGQGRNPGWYLILRGSLGRPRDCRELPGLLRMRVSICQKGVLTLATEPRQESATRWTPDRRQSCQVCEPRPHRKQFRSTNHRPCQHLLLPFRQIKAPFGARWARPPPTISCSSMLAV